MIDSVLLSWTLTAIFGAAALMLLTPNAGARPATVPDRLSHGIHVTGCAAMIIMSWPWAMKVPAWPPEAGFTLAAAWFFVRAVHGPHVDRAQRGGARWRDLHHAAMAGAVTWSIAVMTTAPPMGRHTASPGSAVAGLLATYFVVVTWPWLSMVTRAARKGRRHAAEAASHAMASAGMAVMLLALAGP